MTEWLWRKRVKWLVSLKLPVNHFPGGTISSAPPSDAYLLRLSIAALKALVFDVFPSPTAPNSVKTALCFRQLLARYCRVDENLTLHSATRKFSIPNIIIAEMVWITCFQRKPASFVNLKPKGKKKKFQVRKQLILKPKDRYQKINQNHVYYSSEKQSIEGNHTWDVLKLHGSMA
jgi:hypothetical protein